MTLPEGVTEAYEALIQFLYRAPIGLVQASLDGQIEMANPMAVQLLMPLSTNGGLENLFGTLAEVAPQLPGFVEALAAPSGVVCQSVRIPLKCDMRGQAVHQVLSVSLMKLSPNRLMAVISDVTLEVQLEQQGLERRLNAAARMDDLTRMPNRAVVLEHLQRALQRKPTEPGFGFCVLFLNCDRLKQINDAHSHAVGDSVLSMVADRIRAALRSNSRRGPGDSAEHLAARIGGDEFVVVLNGLAHPDDVHVVAQRLLDALAKPYGVDSSQLHCPVSMGIVMRPQADGDAAGVLQMASIAMVEAKRAGGARYVVFEPSMHARAAQRAGIEEDLRLALAEEQLFVVYQPVVGFQGSRLADGSVDCSAGVEALVRWRHPTRGVVSPADFIGVAEDCGLIDALGDFVLATACRQFVQWKTSLGQLAPRLLAVNLSRSQLSQPDWPAYVAQVLRSTGMVSEQLQLEVTESLAAQDESVQTCLHALKALGLSLALDDFGTGYSSLSSLHQLPVDVVKIDRSFVCQADTSPHHRVLIEATVRVAHSLGMRTVAEGIETAGQAAAVRELQCDKGQGYLFSPPLIAQDLEHWINASSSATRRSAAAI